METHFVFHATLVGGAMMGPRAYFSGPTFQVLAEISLGRGGS